MKNLLSKIILLAAILVSQLAIAQSAVLPADADETPEKKAMKAQLKAQYAQPMEAAKAQQATKKAVAAPVPASQQVAGNPNATLRSATAPDAKTKVAREAKPLALPAQRVTAAPGTLLEKQPVENINKK